MLIDIGANLTNRAFCEDLDEVLLRARKAGLQRILVTGTSVASSRAAAQLANQHPDLLSATAGVHPHEASSLDKDGLAALRELAALDTVVAVGETGLDFNRDYSPRQAQESAFLQQLELAAELRLPLFLHERDALEMQLACLDRFRGSIRGVAHCFTGDAPALEAYLERGLYIGITGWICDERRGQVLRDLVNRIPADRLLVETDAPYLLPRTMRPRPANRRNEPAFLTEVLRVVAETRGEQPEAVARATTENALRLFSPCQPG